MAAYYVLAALLMRNYTDSTVSARYTLWPTWGWALGMGSALLWFLAGLFACCARPPYVRSLHPSLVSAGSMRLMHT